MLTLSTFFIKKSCEPPMNSSILVLLKGSDAWGLGLKQTPEYRLLNVHPKDIRDTFLGWTDLDTLLPFS